MALYRLPAVVLRAYPFSDTHLIVTLFSPTRGKVRAIAKGSRRLHSALGRVVEPMVYAQFQLAEGKNLDVMTQGVVKNSFPGIRQDLDRLTHGLYALELIDRLVEEPEPHAELFFLLLKTLEALDRGAPPDLLLRTFEAHLLRFLGYAPILDHCVHCGESASLSKFSPRLGGALCTPCAGKDKSALAVSTEVLKSIAACFDSVPGEAPGISADAARAVAALFQRFLEEKCGKLMHGYKLLEDVKRIA